MKNHHVVARVLLGVHPSVDVSSNPVCLFAPTPTWGPNTSHSSRVRFLSSSSSSLGSARIHPGREKCLSMGRVRGMVDRASPRLPLVSKDRKGASPPRAVHVHVVVLVWRGMAPRKKKTRVNATAQWLSKYHDVRTRASLGGVRRYAKAHKLPLKKAQRILEQDLAYTLHKPRRRRFPTFP